MIVLDSDFLIAILKKDKDVISKLNVLKNTNDTIAITIFNQQEVLYGVLSKGENEYDITFSFLESFTILNYSKHSMLNAIKIQSSLAKRGEEIGVIDEMIAGICLTNDAKIITRNTKHFSKIKELRIENW